MLRPLIFTLFLAILLILSALSFNLFYICLFFLISFVSLEYIFGDFRYFFEKNEFIIKTIFPKVYEKIQKNTKITINNDIRVLNQENYNIDDNVNLQRGKDFFLSSVNNHNIKNEMTLKKLNILKEYFFNKVVIVTIKDSTQYYQANRMATACLRAAKQYNVVCDKYALVNAAINNYSYVDINKKHFTYSKDEEDNDLLNKKIEQQIHQNFKKEMSDIYKKENN
jgi:hypothetical protein